MGAMIGTFTRIKRNSSTNALTLISIQEKIQEFQTLNYTKKQCERALKYLANKHNTDPFWHSCLTKLYGIANDAYH